MGSGAWYEFRKSLKGMVKASTADIAEKLKRGELKSFFDDADKNNKGELSWPNGEVVPFMRAALGFFGFPEPEAGEMIYHRMFKGFAKMNEKTITYNECLRMIATSLVVALTDE